MHHTIILTITTPQSYLILYTIPPLFFFFLNDTANTEIYTLSLHDALPISLDSGRPWASRVSVGVPETVGDVRRRRIPADGGDVFRPVRFDRGRSGHTSAPLSRPQKARRPGTSSVQS